MRAGDDAAGVVAARTMHAFAGMVHDVVRVRAQLITLVEQVLDRYTGVGLSDADARGFTDDDSRRLSALVDALERLAGGSYGSCAGCGVDIGRERLAELPSTALCAECDADDLWRPFGVH